jgi:hypothetical protein
MKTDDEDIRETDEDGGDDAPEATEEETAAARETPEREDARETRNERRRNRYRDAQDRATKLEQELSQERMARMQAETVAASERAQAAAFYAQQQSGGSREVRDEIAEALEQTYREHDMASREFDDELRASKGVLAPDRLELHKRRARELDQKKIRLSAQQLLREQQQAQPQASPQEMRRMAFMNQNAEVFMDQRAGRYFWATWEARRTQYGDAFDNMDNAKKLLDETRTAFRIGGAATPRATETERARYGGTPSAQGGGGGGSERAALSKEERAMAHEVYAGMEPKLAEKKFRTLMDKKDSDEKRRHTA